MTSAQVVPTLVTKKTTLGQLSPGTSPGGLATTFALTAFLISMIALVKKSVNHLKTVASMRKTGQREGTTICFAAIFVQDLPLIR